MKGWDPVETPLQKDTSNTVEERANSSEELGPSGLWTLDSVQLLLCAVWLT